MTSWTSKKGSKVRRRDTYLKKTVALRSPRSGMLCNHVESHDGLLSSQEVVRVHIGQVIVGGECKNIYVHITVLLFLECK